MDVPRMGKCSSINHAHDGDTVASLISELLYLLPVCT